MDSADTTYLVRWETPEKMHFDHIIGGDLPDFLLHVLSTPNAVLWGIEQ